jgi:hypothetical protein
MNSLHFDSDSVKLTVEQRELLFCLFEEAAEVIQVIAKILRFGYTSSATPSTASNAELLQGEVADFLGIVDRLTELNLSSLMTARKPNCANWKITCYTKEIPISSIIDLSNILSLY